MTLIGMDYLKHQETKRSNLATEGIRRDELAETQFHNRRNEEIAQGNLDELERSNKRNEAIKSGSLDLDRKKFNHQKVTDVNKLVTDLLGTAARNQYLQADMFEKLVPYIDTNSTRPGGGVDMAVSDRTNLYLDRLSDNVLLDSINKGASAVDHSSSSFLDFIKGLQGTGAIPIPIKGDGGSGGNNYTHTEKYDGDGKLTGTEDKWTGKDPLGNKELPVEPNEVTSAEANAALATGLGAAALAALAAWGATRHGKGGDGGTFMTGNDLALAKAFG